MENIQKMSADTMCTNLISQLEIEGYNVKLWYKTGYEQRRKNTYELVIFFDVNKKTNTTLYETNITLYLENNIEKLNDLYVYQLALLHIEKRIESIKKGNY